MGWFSDFVSNPVGTVSDTVSNVVSNPAKAVGDAWNSGGKTAAELAAVYYGGSALMGAGGAGAATTATGAGGATWGTGSVLGNIGTGLAIASGVNALTGGAVTNLFGGGKNTGSGTGGVNTDAQKTADPFSPYRGGMAKAYNDALMGGNKTDITQMPGYSQFQSGVMDPAMEAVQRKMNASGMHMSGNEALELQKTGQQGYYGFMTDYLNRLATGAGASANPASAAQLGLQSGQGYQQSFMQGLGGLGQTFATLGSQPTQSGITNFQNMVPSNNDVTIAMQPGGGY